MDLSTEICSPYLALAKRISRFFARRKHGRSASVKATHSHGPRHRDVHEKKNRCRDKFLRNAERLIKKRIRNATANKNAAAPDVTKALLVLKRKGLDPNSPAELKKLLNDMLSQSNRIQQRRDELLRLDKALCRLDLKWLNKTHGFRLARLTLAQRKIMQEKITEERHRIKIGEEMELLDLKIDLHMTAMGDSLRSAKQCLEREDTAGAAGWLYKTLLEHERTPQLLEKTLIIEPKSGSWWSLFVAGNCCITF